MGVRGERHRMVGKHPQFGNAACYPIIIILPISLLLPPINCTSTLLSLTLLLLSSAPLPSLVSLHPPFFLLSSNPDPTVMMISVSVVRRHRGSEAKEKHLGMHVSVMG